MRKLGPDGCEKRLLLIGFPDGMIEQFLTATGGRAQLLCLDASDTVAGELLKTSVACFIHLVDSPTLAMRLEAIARDSLHPVLIVAMGPRPLLNQVATIAPTVVLRAPVVDPPYVCGVLDIAQMNLGKLAQTGEEQQRARALYRLSSALLKVTGRRQIQDALDETLQPLLSPRLVLLAMPGERQPVMYFRANRLVTMPMIEALYEHLSEAWRVLRPDARDVAWDWLFGLGANVGERGGNPGMVQRFLSTPIAHGNETLGFLTILPPTRRAGDEDYLNSFFVAGDLLSVMLYNIHLRESLEKRATIDGLTTLLNRQALMDHLTAECARSRRYGHPITIVMLDLDFFKKVNDSYGHQAGDEVLRAISGVISANLRTTDLAGRCGGEEFIIVLPDTPLQGGVIWAERLRAAIEARTINMPDRPTIRVSASMGVASARGEDAETDRLIARADSALYTAKEKGRNCVVATPGKDS